MTPTGYTEDANERGKISRDDKDRKRSRSDE